MNHKKEQKKAQEHAVLPWKKIFIGVSLFFFTGLMFLLQEFGSFFTGSIVGTPSTLLEGYACPTSNMTFEVSPVPDLVGFQKGNTEFNRKELLRINKKNHGLTAWYSYDKGFNEAAKAQLIDILAYENDPSRWITRIYNAIRSDKSPHGAVDFVTKWLSPDNHNLKTVFPYLNGLVVEAVEGSAGYGNYVTVCTDVVVPNGKTLRLLYGVGHLDSIAVSEGQTISAGTELGKIGTTGNSTTPHAHITIHPDFIWVSNYKQVYNAGYNFYYASTPAEILVKTIDPIAVMLNPQLAYSIVMDDDKSQALFDTTEKYIAQLNNAVVLADEDLPVDSGTASILQPPASSFNDFKIETSSSQLKAGEWVDVTVTALDQNGDVYSSFQESIDVVLSSSTAQFDGVQQMQQGVTSFRVTDPVPNEVIIQVGNDGSISSEKKVTFLDSVKFLEVTSPQKTTVGKQVVVSLRPVGTYGDVINQQVSVVASVFPEVTDTQEVVLSSGRGEYRFQAHQEGIYELRFTSGDIQESITVAVEIPKEKEEEAVEDANTADQNDEDSTEENADEVVSDGSEDDSVESVQNDENIQNVEQDDQGASQVPAVEQKNHDSIVFLEGENYVIHSEGESTFMAFNDADVQSEYPVEMRFTVPEGTETVSIFTGINDRNFPDTGELKLSKYTPGQEFIRYYPKYVAEDTYKKIVAYKDGQVYAERIFTWSPGSQHVFTDVVEGYTDPEVYAAVKALKEAGVVKGNPDGSYGVNTAINRAATATILIRAFYADVNLDALTVTSIDFNDVPVSAWYASAMWFASQEEFEGQEKPVIIKGFEGRANPDGNVKVEEFVTMVMRILEVDLEVTEPWYQSAIDMAIEFGFMTESERSLVDQPLNRGIVARIMAEAMDMADDLVQVGLLEGKVVDQEELSEILASVDGVGGPESDSLQVSSTSSGPIAATDFEYEFSAGAGLTLEWNSEKVGGFSLYRETVGGAGEIFIGTTGGRSFTDVSAKAGKSYYYRVEYSEGESQRGEVLVEL